MMAKLVHTGYYGWVYDLERSMFIREIEVLEPEDLESLGLAIFPTLSNLVHAINGRLDNHYNGDLVLMLITDIENKVIWSNTEEIQSQIEMYPSWVIEYKRFTAAWGIVL